ncbi:MAG TPA: ATP-binding protein, partial [Trebonia sp.]|nr:ATP-binding protein [Trebonia sp.]
MLLPASVISELVTNAVEATQAARLNTPVRLTLIGGLRTLLVAVWDASPEPPVPAAAADDDESGRGLLIVQALSARWDWKQAPPGRGGKV